MALEGAVFANWQTWVLGMSGDILRQGMLAS